jgi:N-acetylglutamate synthase-like GNAT family acetyltransferase
MEPSFNIRFARIEDVPRIVILSEELGYPSTEEEMRPRLAELLERSDHFVVVACTTEGNVIGWIHVERRLSLEGGEKAELQGLVVAMDARRSGVGRALVAKGEEWAFALGLDIVVRSNAMRPEAHEFYPALGFSRIKSQHVYRKKAPR